MILTINNPPFKLKPVCINSILISFGLGFSTVFFYYGFDYLKKHKYVNFSLNRYGKYFGL